MEVTDAAREYVEEKVGRLSRYYDGLHTVVVTFDRDGGQCAAEIVASGRRKSVFVAHERTDDLYACFDRCLHKLEEQLRRHKDRIRDRHGPPHEETMTPPPPEEP